MKQYVLLVWITFLQFGALSQSKVVVFQSDFGLKDGAVSAMKGVAMGVSPDLKLFDLTHEIPAYNIWEAAYRLNQTASFWPKGTVFVSVVDPGVGSDRKSIVMKSRSGHFFVTPDNGTLTLVLETMGVEEVRLIDESVNRRENSITSYTFHGRDVYAYTAARLAAGVIKFEQVGAILSEDIVRIPFQKPVFELGGVKGTIDILDIQYGNLWTNIDEQIFSKLSMKYGQYLDVKIYHNDSLKFSGPIIFGKTFADVQPGEPVAYFNSLMNLSFAINQDNFSKLKGIESGPGWSVVVRKSR